MLRKYVIPYIIWIVYSLLAWSWRKRVIEPDSMREAFANKEPFIMAHWHGDELGLLHLIKRYRVATMTSTSKDGELMDFAVRKFGGITARGSATRGGIQALKGLIRLLRLGHPTSMAVDGPKGPIYQVKPGVFELSRLAKAKIYPVGVYAENAYCFEKSWNKAILPKPFSKVTVVFSDPLGPVQKTDDSKSQSLANELKEAIDGARHLAGKHIAQP